MIRLDSLEEEDHMPMDYQGMPYLHMGRSGLRTPRVGLGTWKFGYPEKGDGSRTNEAESLAILDRAAELGVMFWDTANRYNFASGNSERILGTWFARNPGRRRDVVLATKTRGQMDGDTPNHEGLSRLQITESVKASLARLQTDWIDVLWFHEPDDGTPIEESLEVVEDLISAGKVHYLGLSNFTVPQLEEALEAASKISRRVRPIAVQNQFDVLDGERKPGVLDLCAGEGLSFVPWSPLARGLLSDRYLDPSKVGAGDRLFDEGSDIPDGHVAKVARLAELAAEYDTTITALTLAYMLTLSGMGTQIPSSSSPEQLEQNAAAGRLDLTDEQVRAVADVLAG